MLDGVNDTPEHAREVVALVQPGKPQALPCKFNLIPFNPFPASGLTRSPNARVQAFSKILSDAGISTFAQLAAAKEEHVKNILVEKKFRFGNPATMIEQAKLAAAGKMAELEALKAELKGGKRK